MYRRMLAVCWLVVLFSACQQPAPVRSRAAPDDLPVRLSDWHLYSLQGGVLSLREDLTAYDLNSALFSDYAHKLRAIRIPARSAIRYGAEDFDFPVGTVIAKTFYYPRAGQSAGDGAILKDLREADGEQLDLHEVRLLETRLLINTAAGWIAAPYVWNAAQTDATLELAGESFALELVAGAERQAFEYVVPDVNQCAGCHAADHHRQVLRPIGVKARHLNKDRRYAERSENQLTHWMRTGLLQGAPAPERAPRNAPWNQPGNLDARARSYLDVNCGHCHNAHAAASTSGLSLDAAEQDPHRRGVCKIPVASGRGSGNGTFDIVPGHPEDSILLYRMAAIEPDVAMPELGRSLVHQEGVALISEWIASLDGDCRTTDQLTP